MLEAHDLASTVKSPGVYSQSPGDALAGSVTVSEIMTKNAVTIADEDTDFSDWIEIANSGRTVADVGGWFFSQDATLDPDWTFPQGTLIEPGGFLLVWASGALPAWPTS